ncbi:glutathione S-transferase [Actibacterium mucosum KCTC 23349]|uniref:Glutathione S-transferase n=1 Tax=Actibacterium mucosum KCTC 23349 TaxID=1454373 RepID=A0A037ZLY4_9RHOB|nr:glutathione S-transferase [Actibacterium mucosum]KAJ57114.1 glutathione S-transferase [Actibacterium mucosum KCTC 23349]
MKLYSAPASPFVRKVAVLLHETGQIDDVEMVAAGGHPLASEQMPLAHNPLGKIPALEREDGPAIYDSAVICRFLGEAHGMYPEARLYEALTLEATADGICDAAILMIYETRCRAEDQRSAEWVEAQWEKVTRSLDAIEDRWMSHLAGPLDIGQIAVACALAYIDFRHGSRDWRAERPQLTAWFEAFSARPAMQATVPQG